MSRLVDNDEREKELVKICTTCDKKRCKIGYCERFKAERKRILGELKCQRKLKK